MGRNQHSACVGSHFSSFCDLSACLPPAVGLLQGAGPAFLSPFINSNFQWPLHAVFSPAPPGRFRSGKGKPIQASPALLSLSSVLSLGAAGTMFPSPAGHREPMRVAIGKPGATSSAYGRLSTHRASVTGAGSRISHFDLFLPQRWNFSSRQS